MWFFFWVFNPFLSLDTIDQKVIDEKMPHIPYLHHDLVESLDLVGYHLNRDVDTRMITNEVVDASTLLVAFEERMPGAVQDDGEFNSALPHGCHRLTLFH